MYPNCHFSHTDVFLAELSLVCKAVWIWEGFKALCIFKLSHFVKFILDKSFFVVLVSYFLIFP